uniref:Uncharacterized protein n=1 Tax=Ciona intestinalis TaxID=7719 RepID=F6XW60_CIOIN
MNTKALLCLLVVCMLLVDVSESFRRRRRKFIYRRRFLYCRRRFYRRRCFYGDQEGAEEQQQDNFNEEPHGDMDNDEMQEEPQE